MPDHPFSAGDRLWQVKHAPDGDRFVVVEDPEDARYGCVYARSEATGQVVELNATTVDHAQD